MNDTVEYRLSESKNSNTAVHTYLFRPAEPAPRKNKVYAVCNDTSAFDEDSETNDIIEI